MESYLFSPNINNSFVTIVTSMLHFPLNYHSWFPGFCLHSLQLKPTLLYTGWQTFFLQVKKRRLFIRDIFYFLKRFSPKGLNINFDFFFFILYSNYLQFSYSVPPTHSQRVSHFQQVKKKRSCDNTVFLYSVTQKSWTGLVTF